MQDREIVQALDDHLDRSLDRFQNAMAPIWESQDNLGRTVVTLTSSVLVLSITVFRLPETSPEAQVRWAPLLFTSWFLFAASAVVGAVRFGWVGKGQLYRALLEQDRVTIRRKILSLEKGAPDIDEQVDKALEEWMRPAWSKSRDAAGVHDALIGLMFLTFVGGLVCFLVFAVINF